MLSSRAVLHLRERAAAGQIYSTVNPPIVLGGVELVAAAGDPDAEDSRP